MNGVLANVIEVPEEYQTAIEMCLGASLQNIVTETEDDAKRLVEHLRKNNLGRASFLPITSVKGRKIDKIKGNEDGVIGIASDLIKFNKKYEQIILNLLGRTVIVDNMETAIKVAKKNGYSFRIITLEGDVINASGSITGGSVANKTVNILGRGREIEKLEKNLKNLKTKIEKLQKEKEEYVEVLKSLDLGLETRLTSKVGLLSGGQRQAVTLLMATLKKPKILLLDEHTAALDPKTAKKVLDLTEKIVARDNLTTIMITHNMKDAINIGNRLIMMNEGKIIYDVSGEEKKNLTTADLLAKFKVTSGGEEFDNDRVLLSTEADE